MPQGFDVIDNLNSRFSAPWKWGLAGLGGAAGFAYAQQHGSSTPASCVVAGAAVGLGFMLLLVSGLKLVKHLIVAVAVLILLNYAVLIPFGYGNHMPGWLGMARQGGGFVMGGLTRLADQWVRGGAVGPFRSQPPDAEFRC